MADIIKTSQSVLQPEYEVEERLKVSQVTLQPEYETSLERLKVSQLLMQVEYIQGVFVSQLLAQIEYEPDPIIAITKAVAQVERSLWFGYVHTAANAGGTIDTALQTKDGTGGDITGIFKRKNAQYLWYDANTNGEDLTVSFYVDGVLQAETVTINTTTRTRDRVDLPNWEGYRFNIRINANDLTTSGMKVYSPWHIVYQPFGE